jgi:hypothetical protein
LLSQQAVAADPLKSLSVRYLLLLFLATSLPQPTLATEVIQNSPLSATPWFAFLDFPVNELFELNQQELSVRENRLLEATFSGIAVNAPAVVDWQTVTTLPVLLASKFNGLRDWSMPMPLNTLLAAINHRNGRLYLANALLSAKGLHSFHFQPPDPATRPDEEDAQSDGVSFSRINALAKLPVLRQSGRWTLRVVYFDWASNPVTITTENGDQSTEQSYARENLSTANILAENVSSAQLTDKVQINRPANCRQGNWLSARYRQKSKPDHSPGVAGKVLIVEGAVNTTVAAANLPDVAVQYNKTDDKNLKTSVSIPANLVIIRKNDINPLQASLEIPLSMFSTDRFSTDRFSTDRFSTHRSSKNKSSKNRAIAETCDATGRANQNAHLQGYFSVEMLKQSKSGALPAGDYVAFLFTGSQLSGPAYFKVP